jgi:hypothetical protein
MLSWILAALSLWLGGRIALRREGRTGGLLTTLLAPLGRIVTLPEGTELLAGKRYYFHPRALHEPTRVWVGWWSCGSFASDEARYYFFRRGSRYAIRVDAIPTGTELMMQMIFSGAIAAVGMLSSVAGLLARRRTIVLRRSGRRPDPVEERRAATLLRAGIVLVALACVIGLLRL